MGGGEVGVGHAGALTAAEDVHAGDVESEAAKSASRQCWEPDRFAQASDC